MLQLLQLGIRVYGPLQGAHMLRVHVVEDRDKHVFESRVFHCVSHYAQGRRWHFVSVAPRPGEQIDERNAVSAPAFGGRDNYLRPSHEMLRYNSRLDSG